MRKKNKPDQNCRNLLPKEPDNLRRLLISGIVSASIAPNFLNNSILKFLAKIRLSNITRSQVNETISNAITVIHTSIVSLARRAQSISLTYDLWSSKNHSHSYLAISFHLIDENILKSGGLFLKEVTFPHTSAKITELILQTLNDFEISSAKINYSTTDGAKNVKNALSFNSINKEDLSHDDSNLSTIVYENEINDSDDELNDTPRRSKRIKVSTKLSDFDYFDDEEGCCSEEDCDETDRPKEDDDENWSCVGCDTSEPFSSTRNLHCVAHLM
ncbi:hypothetical protein SNEBB_007968, partial [Seison nebaliae]